jgi:hypothetical protein
MRWVSRAALIVIGLLAAYVAWPIYTALKIRDAMIACDSAALAARIDWSAVRSSLKASMSAQAMAKLDADPDAPARKRIKRTVAPRLAGGAIDRYVTPEYLPVLLGYHRFWRGTVQPALREDPPTVLAGTLLAGSAANRFISFYRRLRRAAFVAPTTMVVEVEDKYTSDRHYTATLNLQGWEWKLTGLAISGL